MNREELKKALKPLIKQCIKEVLLEETGVLSKIVSEVAVGLVGDRQVVTETAQEKVPQRNNRDEERKRASRELQEHKRKMLAAIGGSAYNGIDLFEGTTPMTSAGSPTPQPSNGPMRDMDPNDPGVDINSIPGLNLDVARKLMGD